MAEPVVCCVIPPMPQPTTNVAPVKPITGLDTVHSDTMRGAIIRATTEIFNTEPNNMGLTARVKGRKNAAVLSIHGITKLKSNALDPSQWSMDAVNASCIADVRFDVASKSIAVLIRDPDAHGITPFQPAIPKIPEVVPGKIGCADFIGVHVGGDVDQPLLCVSSLIAANVLSVARRREGMPNAIAVTRTDATGPCYIVETKGLIMFDARALTSTTWAGDDWPTWTSSDKKPTSLPMYFDVATCTHRTLVQEGQISGALISVAQERCKIHGTVVFPDARFGFRRTYTVSDDIKFRTKRPVTDQEDGTPDAKRVCTRTGGE